MTAAERKRRSRERQREGLRSLNGTVAVSDDVLRLLVDAGLMPPGVLSDDTEAAEAIGWFLHFCAGDEARGALAATMLCRLIESGDVTL